MRDFYITTDSDSDLPKEYIEKYNTIIITLLMKPFMVMNYI